jgi:hypothetical protein
VPLAPAVPADEVLQLVQGLAIPDDLKAQVQAELVAAMAEGRLTPGVAYAFLSEVQSLSPGEQTDAMTMLVHALQGGFILDPLLNEALKGLRLNRPWPEVAGVLGLRINLLVAAQQVLGSQGLLASPAPQYGFRTTSASGPPPTAELVLETAWAIGDFLVAGGSPADLIPMTSLVETRLSRLRDRILPAELVDPVLEALSPALIQEIVELALNPERR